MINHDILQRSGKHVVNSIFAVLSKCCLGADGDSRVIGITDLVTIIGLLTITGFTILFNMMNNCIWMVITLLFVPLLNCHCEEHFENTDACSACQQDGPYNLCEHLCLDELEYYASEEGYQNVKFSFWKFSFPKESLFLKIDSVGPSLNRISYTKTTSHIYLRVIQV